MVSEILKRHKLPLFLILLVLVLVVAPIWAAFCQIDWVNREISDLGRFYGSLASSAGLMLAITVAFYGERIKRVFNVPDLRIELVESPDRMLNFHEKEMRRDGASTRFKKGGDHYSHHLRVVNEKQWNPVEGCQVWLTEIQQFRNGKWTSEDFRFAVHRLMKWAPAEFAPDRKMSFADEWVLDFGQTYFEVDVNAFVLEIDQGGNFGEMARCELNERRRYLFRVKAANCSIEKVFTVELEYTDNPAGKPVWWTKSKRWSKFKIVSDGT